MKAQSGKGVQAHPAYQALVREIDPSAFVVIIDAHEVLGLGFKSRL
jgi:uncharacterized membrane-anchored protein YitT (DUF2179 family)